MFGRLTKQLLSYKLADKLDKMINLEILSKCILNIFMEKAHELIIKILRITFEETSLWTTLLSP